MPNYCRNEINFWVDDWGVDTVPRAALMQQILDFMRETNASFQERLMDMRAEDRKNKTFLYDRTLAEHAPTAFDFNNLIPYPTKFKEMDRDYAVMSKEDYAKKYPESNRNVLGTKTDHHQDGYNSGGYRWCIEHWGSKWNAIASVYVPLHKTLYFDTAWSPVFKIVSELHKRFPTVMMSYEYYERGTAVIGGCEFIPESMFDPSDYVASEVPAIEKALKQGKEPPPTVWAPGVPYNLWSADYMGYKGG